MVPNVEVTPGVNKKLLPKFKGPYVIKKCLPNDRYVIKDVDGFQVTQRPFEGIFDADHLKLWTNSHKSDNELCVNNIQGDLESDSD